MPKKQRKSKGTAQKKAVAAKGGKERPAAAADAEEQEGSIEERVAKLNIDAPQSFDEDALLDDAIKLAVAEKSSIRPCWSGCDHGFTPHDARMQAFLYDFAVKFDATADRTSDLATSLAVATNATRKEYANLVNDSAKMKAIVSVLLAKATQLVLDGKRASGDATFAYYFEQYIAVSLEKTQTSFYLRKIFEIHINDEHKRTLISFLRKRIPCSCLDQLYENVKDMAKMGICCNFKPIEFRPVPPEGCASMPGCCSLPDGKIDRNKMLRCSGCNLAYYCSRKCQKSAWPEHKRECLENAEEKAKFDSKQQSMMD